ncbi:putative CAMK family protein kinase [Blattamonas nauphoetae]|uniref:CAMK family protein kinase n=1 Tax=Blattamonas nauphoetae TaxID=2049346 RepID=A0ABQ9YJC9_9EUKA|nr:putative CAMK family protein kinase [Blattamonas nauphoetae]
MTDPTEVPEGYSFVREISSGGFGSVVELMENSTKEHYAGKMIPGVTAKDKDRIDREVNRLRTFAHPGIVALKEVASMGNMKVIVMELGEQSLAEIVRDHTSRGVLVAREVVYRVMVDVSSALNSMHSHETGTTAHGDVKMENILLFPGGHFKLCDLGAAESETGSSTRSVMSQLYVSPEQMESETGRATCSSDVWALGIVLHWLLFGEPLFKNKSILKLGQEISSFQVSMIGESCGGEERALLMRMLDPNPETRVTSRQLCSFGVFRCIINTKSALWRLKDADEIDLHSEKEKIQHELEIEKNIRQRDQEQIQRMKEELENLKEKLAKSEPERQAHLLHTSLRTILYDCQPQSGVQSLHVLQGDIVEVLADDTNGWTWSKKYGTEDIGYVPTHALGPDHAPHFPEQIETPMSLVLDYVNPSQNFETEIKNFFSQFGEIYYFDSNPPSHLHLTHRFFIDILSKKDLDAIKSSLLTQPFYSQRIKLNKKFKQPNPLELYLTPISPTCTEADIRALIHPANPTKTHIQPMQHFEIDQAGWHGSQV